MTKSKILIIILIAVVLIGAATVIALAATGIIFNKEPAPPNLMEIGNGGGINNGVGNNEIDTGNNANNANNGGGNNNNNSNNTENANSGGNTNTNNNTSGGFQINFTNIFNAARDTAQAIVKASDVIVEGLGLDFNLNDILSELPTTEITEEQAAQINAALIVMKAGDVFLTELGGDTGAVTDIVDFLLQIGLAEETAISLAYKMALHFLLNG